MLNRDEILSRAVHECYCELYKKAQPSADYDELIRLRDEGKISDEHGDEIYKRYYISDDEMKYIVNKYEEAYNILPTWYDHMDLAIKYLKEGGYTDVYTEDENGCTHRDAAKTSKLSELIGEEYANTAIGLLEKCRDFYRFDREQSSFEWTIYLGCAPNSNKEAVVEYWKKQGKDIEIEDRDPKTFWLRDEYGDEWKEVWEEEQAYDSSETEEEDNNEA